MTYRYSPARNRRHEQKGPFKGFRLLPGFSFDKSVERMLGPFEQVCDFVESAEKSRKLVKLESNQI